jgi:hypothetical protein
MPQFKSSNPARSSKDRSSLRQSIPEDGLSALLSALDELAVGDDSSLGADEEMRRLESDVEQWIQRFVRPAVSRNLPLPGGALDIIAALVPDASLTQDRIAALEAKRRQARSQIDAKERAEATCSAEAPGQVFLDLRTRASLDATSAAEALGITTAVLASIERREGKWHQVPASCLPVFASKVRVPLVDLACSLRLAATRCFVFEVKQRTQLALGRFDSNQEPSEADRSALRLALARLQDDNRAAGRFFRDVDALLARSQEDS